MSTLTTSDKSPSATAQIEPELSLATSHDGMEWDFLQRLCSHHKRLNQKTRYQPLNRSLNRTRSIKWQDSITLFDTDLRQIFISSDLHTIVAHKLENNTVAAQSHLTDLCALLNKLVNADILPHDLRMARQGNLSLLYPNLSLLVQVLDDTDWNFELVTGKENVLFTLDSEADTVNARNLVRRFGDFFSPIQSLVLGFEQPEIPAGSSWHLRKELRDRAMAGLRSLFRRDLQVGSRDCNGHTILVELPDWESIDQSEGQKTGLDLFLSTCSDPTQWHAACCNVQSTISNDDCHECALCEDLMDAYDTNSVFRFTASNGKLFLSREDNEDRPTDPYRQPSMSLHDLIDGCSFIESIDRNRRKPHKKTQRFPKRQKRALAARLALCLSLYLDSEYILKVHDSKAVLFTSDNPRCERNQVYVTTDANDTSGRTDLSGPIPIYLCLAKLLLEVGYDVSTEGLSLQDVKALVDDMLQFNREDLDLEYHDDMVNMRDIEGKRIFLTAVRDLLKFEITYRRGRRSLDWLASAAEDDTVGTIAREIIFTKVAEKIRSSIAPAGLQIVGLASQKEDNLYQQRPPVRVGASRTDEMGFSTSSTSKGLTKLPKQTVIRLFDEKDETSLDSGKAERAEFFFDQVEEWLVSCEERAEAIKSNYGQREHQLEESCEESAYRIPSHSHKRVRIAVLDTGIDESNIEIVGGMATGRIRKQNCKSWVGEDSHDNSGHGTRVTQLILKVAPEADIYVCKVFNGTEIYPNEARNVAKAITHAVDEWKVDIISMSFGLEPLGPSDPIMQEIYDEINLAIEQARTKTFFAAAANHGGHGPRTFPASHPDVICINASDGKGNDGGINPKPGLEDQNFMTLGIAVNFEGVRKSGTSYAAPIAAAMAAHTLYITDCLLKLTPRARDGLRTRNGVRKMFGLMIDPWPPGTYHFVAPWEKLWRKNWHCDEVYITWIETTIRTTYSFQ